MTMAHKKEKKKKEHFIVYNLTEYESIAEEQLVKLRSERGE